MSTTSEQLGEQAKEVEDVERMGGTVRDAAQQTLGKAGERAAEYCEQGLERIHGGACACEQFLRTKPLTSLLLAVGIGWVLGRFWKRG